MKKDYHSALQEELHVSGELDFYTSNGSTVLYYDICSGVLPLSIHLKGVDVIYSEPSWKDGYKVFLSRVGSEAYSWSDYLAYLRGISNIVRGLGVPSFLLIGKHMVKHLNPDTVVTLSHHGYPSLLGIWNVSGQVPEGLANSGDIVEYVSSKYAKVWDFCCGYGNIAQAMRSKGKQFVCSDINKKCLYYIADKLLDRSD